MGQNDQRVKELDLTLDDLHAIIDALDNDAKATSSVRYRAYLQDLSDRLLGLWSYWCDRTKSTSTFTLRIKRV